MFKRLVILFIVKIIFLSNQKSININFFKMHLPKEAILTANEKSVPSVKVAF